MFLTKCAILAAIIKAAKWLLRKAENYNLGRAEFIKLLGGYDELNPFA